MLNSLQKWGHSVTLIDVPLRSTKYIYLFMSSQGIVSESFGGKGLWCQQHLTNALMAIEN